MVRLIARLGEAWNDDPRIAFVEMGIIGDWGEHHDPDFGNLGFHPLPASIENEFADAFAEAFPTKLLMHRYPRDFDGYRFGIHWDVFGSFDRGFWGNDSSGMTAELEKPGWRELWKTLPMGGEIDPTFLGEPDFSNRSQQNVVKKHADRLVELIDDLHWNHLGVIESINRDDVDLWEEASRIQMALGYRFVIEEASYSGRVVQGDPFRLRMTVRNTGSSPFYYRWPLAIALLDSATHRPVWSAVWEDVDIRAWMPDSRYDIEGSFTIPEDVPDGRYILSVSILDPSGMVPAARFAVQNYYNGGRTPLGPIGVSSDPRPLEIGGFDDLQSDRSLFYLPRSDDS